MWLGEHGRRRPRGDGRGTPAAGGTEVVTLDVDPPVAPADDLPDFPSPNGSLPPISLPDDEPVPHLPPSDPYPHLPPSEPHLPPHRPYVPPPRVILPRIIIR